MEQSLISPVTLKEQSLQRHQQSISSAEKQQRQSQRQNQKEQVPAKQSFIHYPQIDWKLNEFDPIATINKLQSIYSEKQNWEKQKQKQDQIHIKVTEYSNQGNGISKYVAYTIKGNDKDGEFQIMRRYKQFDLLHEKLALRWPGIYLPAIPNKTIIGNTQKQVSNNRMRFLNNFLKKIAGMPSVYYQQQVQAFLKSTPQQVQKKLQSFKKISQQDILKKYKICFSGDKYQPQIYQQVDVDNMFLKTVNDLRDTKTDLSAYKNNLKRLAELRDKYKQKQKTLFLNLMPQFEITCFQWWQNKNVETMEQNKRIFNDVEFKNSIQQNKVDFFETNPYWQFYDIIKFQLREIDGLIYAIENAKTVLNKKKYLERTIEINKQQMEALTQKKTTLKTFFMGGSQEQKRTNLTNQSQKCQNQLNTVTQLYGIVVGLGIRSFRQFYAQRLNFYKQIFSKIAHQEISIIMKQMKFHLHYQSSIQQ